ncbi:MAG: YHYH protein [Proteobacteria bacterium]|nr:YHYH protein [Pseudomonadota bacterium]
MNIGILPHPRRRAIRAMAAVVFLVAAPSAVAAHGTSQTEPAQNVDASILHLIGLTRANEIQSAQNWSVKNRVEIRISGDKRIIRANGIPAHETGRFPNRGNPNTIREQNYVFRVDVTPEKRIRIEALELGKFGVAVNGVPFDPGAAEFWNRDRRSGWRYEALGGAINLGLDSNNAHVQPNGAYHYHGLPTGLIESWSRDVHSAIVGYAADGFPIYAVYGLRDPTNATSPVAALRASYAIKNGVRSGGPGGKYDGTFVEDYEFIAGAGDLDECNGRNTVTPDYPQGTYAYFLTESYPFIPRCFRGAPDSSFTQRRGPGPDGLGPGEDPFRRGPPPPRRGQVHP